MIRVHHLNDSRSQRILWLLEELGVPYELVKYRRDPETRLAPPELEALHPLGKSPMLELEGRLLIESGAIIETVLARVGKGRLVPPAGSADHDRYIMWLHYAEGSAMLPLMLRLYTARLGEAAGPLQPRIDSELQRHLGWVNSELEGREWLIGDDMTGADIQMSFVGEIAGFFGLRAQFPALDGWVKRFQARPAYQRALEKGGTYNFR
ncbi:MAG: glutathione S-transferase [Sandarakinorhabdus sp.]|nr:glutathione S-transferase [Sandarakinorhabdus sp.]